MPFLPTHTGDGTISDLKKQMNKITKNQNKLFLKYFLVKIINSNLIQEAL